MLFERRQQEERCYQHQSGGGGGGGSSGSDYRGEEKEELFNISEEEESEEEEDDGIGKQGATEQELEWLDLVDQVREQARAGDVNESLIADSELAQLAFRIMPDPRLLGGSEAAVCQMFEELDPRYRVPEDRDVAAAIEWVRMARPGPPPKGCDKRCIALVLQCRNDLLSPRDWTQVERLARARNEQTRAKMRAAKVKPRQNSASIAVYNNTRQHHFARSQQQHHQGGSLNRAAAALEDGVDDALRCCSLRATAVDGSRRPAHVRLPLSLFDDNDAGRRPPRGAEDDKGAAVVTPDGFFRNRSLDLDVEGEVAAVSANPEGSIGVFFPPNRLSEDNAPLARGDPMGAAGPILAEGGCDESRRSNEERVWTFATDRDRSWLVEGYEARGGGLVARLEFPLAFKSKFATWRPAMTRCLDRIIAGLGDSRLYVWSITDALRDFETAEYAARARKKPRSNHTSAYHHHRDEAASCAREMIVSDDVYWSVGDCQRLTDSTVCLSPASESRYSSLRVFDARHEQTVRLLAGHREASSLGRQHCASSHDLVFSIEHRTSAALVFDLRKAAPVFVLPCCGRLFSHHDTNGDGLPRESGILGIPCAGPSSMAFTWTTADQCLRAWDLRKPAYHAYSLSTGNRNVTHLAWHASSASLFAATKSPYHNHHHHHRARTATTKESVDSGAPSSSPVVESWPREAVHRADYFSEALDLSSRLPHRAILHYAFDDGRPLLDPRPKQPRPPSWP